MRRVSFARIAFTGVMAAWVTAGSTIIIRDDVDDSKYREFGKQFPMVGDLGGVACVLIADRWILTAGHVGLQDVDSPYRRAAVRFGERMYQVERIYRHPSYKLNEGLSNGVDLALVKLMEPVTGVQPAPLFREPSEVTEVAILVGRGTTGTGNSGSIEGSEGVLRAATNRIESATGTTLVMRFDEPAKATPLEGISGFGDSGGPAFISRDGKYFVAGISSNNSGVPGTCVYGSEDRYARVSAVANWIDEMMRSEPPSPFDWGEVQPVQASPFDSGTPLNPAIQAFLAAYNSLQAGQVERLMEYWPSSKGLDARIKTLSSLREQYGTMAPRSFSVRADQEVDVLFFCSKIQGLRRLRFRPGAHSAQIGNIAIREVEGV